MISSFGFTARWRHQAVQGLPSSDAHCVIDLMSGMGELWRSLANSLPPSARVIGVDLSPAMAGRTPRNWLFATEVLVADALEWDGPAGSADVVVSSFGLKTFDREQQRRLAGRVARMLKTGGCYSFVEISVPPFAPLRLLYMLYLKVLIPVIGRLLLAIPIVIACWALTQQHSGMRGTSPHACARQAWRPFRSHTSSDAPRG